MPTDRLKLAQADLIIAEPHAQLRRALREGIVARGFERIVTTRDFDETTLATTDARPDLLICDVDLPGGDVFDFIKAIRHGDAGDNPFLVIVAMVEYPTEDRVWKIVGSGVDAILVKPLAVRTMLDHITALIHSRKPFAITSDYVGPDRRIGRRDGDAEPHDAWSTIEVPNTLSQKAHGTYDPAAVEQAIGETASRVNEHKVIQHAAMINAIVGQIIPYYESGSADDSVRIHIRHLIRVGRDISRRIKDTENRHVVPLCASLIKLAHTIEGRYLEPDPKDIALLKKLSLAIFTAFQSGEAAGLVSRHIADTVVTAQRKVG